MTDVFPSSCHIFEKLIEYASSGIVMVRLITWVTIAWGVVTHAMMILCVSPMFNRPKRATYILSALYSLVIIQQVAIEFLLLNPGNGLVVLNASVSDITLCIEVPGRFGELNAYSPLGELIFDILLMVLVLYRFALHAIERRRIMGKQRVNRYMKLLLEHNTLYFLVNVVSRAITLGESFNSRQNLLQLVGLLYNFTIPFVICTRLVLNFKGSRLASDGIYVEGDGSRNWQLQSQLHGQTMPTGGPASDGVEAYELTNMIFITRGHEC